MLATIQYRIFISSRILFIKIDILLYLQRTSRTATRYGINFTKGPKRIATLVSYLMTSIKPVS